MADAAAGQASRPARSLLPAALAGRFELTDERRRLLRDSVVVFLLTFLVYWSLGPKSTPYDYQLSQANNFIHGHLDMTAEYTRNLRVLERVLYDPAVGYCLPVNDDRVTNNPPSYEDSPDAPITADCKHYMQHSLGPALMLVPVALIVGVDTQQGSSPIQPFVGAVIGGLTALFAFGIVRRFTQHRPTVIALTVLVSFGTTYWYSASDGSVWHFATTTAVFFVFGSIYATLVMRNPLLAGAFVGMAFMCRPTTGLAGIFPLIVFADQWLPADAEGPIWRRVRLRPLIALAVGVAPFVGLTALLNYLRFHAPFESGYTFSEEFHQLSLIARWPYGVADPRYMPRHVQVFFEQMPNFGREGSYIWPSWWGLAMWVTTPPILYSLFVHLKRWATLRLAGILALAATCGFLLLRASEQALGAKGWGDDIFSTNLHLVPFFGLAAVAVGLAIATRDRLVIGAWVAALAILIADWQFAATGWAQFGYRYGLDFMPFLFVLILTAVGKRIAWHHAVLIGIGVLVNLWGVLWIFQFMPAQLFGWTWVSY
jgi:hypothetical protein